MAIKISGNTVIDDSQNVTSTGSASFASGSFVVDSNGYIQTNINTAGSVKLNSTADFANPKIELNSVTGNSTFDGDMGLGTLFPTQKLDVRGNVYVGDDIAVDGSASFVSGGTTIDDSSGLLVTSSSGAKSQLNGDGFYQIKTDGSTNAATILASGAATFGSLDLSSTTAYGATIDQISGSHSGIRVQSTDTATSVGEFFAGYRGSSMAFQVTTGGALKAASGAFEVQVTGNVVANKSVNLTNGYGAGTDGNAALFTRNAANDTTTSMITYDGSTTFGSTSGGGSGTGGMQFTASNGQLDLVNTNSGSLITGYNRGSTSQVFSVSASGVVTAAGYSFANLNTLP